MSLCERARMLLYRSSTVSAPYDRSAPDLCIDVTRWNELLPFGATSSAFSFCSPDSRIYIYTEQWPLPATSTRRSRSRSSSSSSSREVVSAGSRPTSGRGRRRRVASAMELLLDPAMTPTGCPSECPPWCCYAAYTSIQFIVAISTGSCCRPPAAVAQPAAPATPPS